VEESTVLENPAWAWPVIVYLFLVGLGSGAATVSASIFLRGGGGNFPGPNFAIARYGALIAPLPVIVGTALLVLVLGGEGHNPFKDVNLFRGLQVSPVDLGLWLLGLFMIVSLAYAYTFRRADARPGDDDDGLRKLMAWIAVPSGMLVAIYTAVMLAAIPAQPLWNSPILAMLFLLSSLSMGLCAIILARALVDPTRHDADRVADYNYGGYLLMASDTILISFEILVIFLFVLFAHLAVGQTHQDVDVIMFGGALASHFWVGVVFAGMVLPVLIEIWFVMPELLHRRGFSAHHGLEVVVPLIVLVGAFMLRFVVLSAGQG